MNLFDRHLSNVGRPGLAARLAVCVAVSAGLSACLAHPIAETKVDPASPIAPYVAQAARLNTGYPKFSDIPANPKDVLPPAAIRTRVQALQTARADLVRRTAPETWTLSNTQAFASTAQRQVGPDINGASATPATEAFAATQRQRATPPPQPAN